MKQTNSMFDKRAGASDIIIDCGATKHCTPHASQLDAITDRNPNRSMRVGNGSTVPVTAIGTMSLQVPTIWHERRKKKVSVRTGMETMKLSNVMVVPGMHCRLFSCRWAYEHDGITTHLNGDQHLRLPSGSRVPFKNSSKHYIVEGALGAEDDMTDDDASLAHARLGHFSVARINSALGHDGLKAHTFHDCEACKLNGARKPRPKVASAPTVYSYFGERVSSDTCGPFPPSPQGYTYAINFVDAYSKYSATYFLKTQDSSEVLLAAQTFVADHKQWLINTIIPGSVDTWFTDNGSEFLSNSIDEFCGELGTRHALSAPHVPQRNGAAERLWGILLRPMRTMIAHSGGLDTVKETLWPYLMSQATLIHNALPTRGHTPPQAPVELLTPGSVQGVLDHFRVMLCDCFVSLLDDDIPRAYDGGKLANRRIKAVHLGWDTRRRGYFVYIPELRRVTTVIDIEFDERSFSTLGELKTPVRTAKQPEQGDLPVPHRRSSVPTPPAPKETPALTPAPAAAAAPVPAVRLVMRGDARSDSAEVFDDVDSVLLAGALHDPVLFQSSSVGELLVASEPSSMGPIPIPRTYTEALADRIYHDRWREAMIEEIKGKYEINKSWDLVTAKDLPKGRKPMKGKWVFKVEYNDDGSVKRFKARWVGCGYSQIPGIDFNATYASTLRVASFRLFMAMTAVDDNELEEGDVIKAFTQGDMDDTDLYVEQPHGFADPAMAACRLKRPLEGTKQAAHLFSVTSAQQMEKLGFSRSKAEPNLYWKTSNNTTIKIGIYVDNILVSYPNTTQGREMKDAFWKGYRERFNVEMRGVPTKFMGVKISRDRKAKTITLSQEKYIAEACDRFLNSTCTKSFSTPVHSSKTAEFMKITTAKDDVERATMATKPFMSLMGSLLWATFTRPEIQYYVSFLCQFMHDPSTEAYEAALNILAYLSSTRSLGITYDGTRAHVSVFSDSSWGQVPFPFGGHVVFFCGAAVSFQARKLKIAPQSSAEAETAVYSAAAKDLRFVINVIGTDALQHVLSLPINIFCDNSAAVTHISNVGATSRTKHYEIWVGYGREQYINRVSQPVWVATTEQVADVFTKALDKTTFLKFRGALLNISHDAVTENMWTMIRG